eukprot:CAMPEP_0117048590 /NCGR_PEP_ID=MMETSP0472-20121206/33587_1 /TAXON_ID=693140 ORGANISM="Tiarina fusus, Strain LIS" /NCGR_SAMPLE_ID=MMETSP0472 /ASSEMBLY_ACC=CAM_ASM_000603 /LENGTH=510 /DNA_ID=CAMNT_0004761745 /DNA_START=142 /DNA_END=1674 /DNA_ORIENTATION=-
MALGGLFMIALPMYLVYRMRVTKTAVLLHKFNLQMDYLEWVAKRRRYNPASLKEIKLGLANEMSLLNENSVLSKIDTYARKLLLVLGFKVNRHRNQAMRDFINALQADALELESIESTDDLKPKKKAKQKQILRPRIDESLQKYRVATYDWQRLYFMHGDFKSDRYYWEVVDTMRKLAMTSLIVVVTQVLPGLDLVLGLIISSIFLVMQTGLQPYRQRKPNILKFLLQIVEFSTIFVLLLLTIANGTGRYNSETLGTFLAGINVGFVALVLLSNSSRIISVLKEFVHELWYLLARRPRPFVKSGGRSASMWLRRVTAFTYMAVLLSRKIQRRRVLAALKLGGTTKKNPVKSKLAGLAARARGAAQTSSALPAELDADQVQTDSVDSLTKLAPLVSGAPDTGTFVVPTKAPEEAVFSELEAADAAGEGDDERFDELMKELQESGVDIKGLDLGEEAPPSETATHKTPKKYSHSKPLAVFSEDVELTSQSAIEPAAFDGADLEVLDLSGGGA